MAHKGMQESTGSLAPRARDMARNQGTGMGYRRGRMHRDAGAMQRRVGMRWDGWIGMPGQ
jgi:hypothetical protein